jgi:anti-sigma factor RsiW
VNCSDFQSNLDPYLDGELDAAKMPAAAQHVARCRTCDHVVTDHQKARALLITAVADRAAAVDVSGVWNEISRRLDEPQPRVTFLWAFRERRALNGRRAGAPATAIGIGAFASAAAAAALIVTMVTGEPKTPTRTAVAPSRPEVISLTTGTGRVAQSRRVRIDSMDVGAGHTVSTWIKPRTKTRVIWVASSPSTGYGVSRVSQAR